MPDIYLYSGETKPAPKNRSQPESIYSLARNAGRIGNAVMHNMRIGDTSSDH